MKIVLCDSSTINSYGFRTDVSGIDLERFSKNPVMLYNHDPERVIGRWENIEVTENRLMAEPVFDTADPFAAEIERKVSEGFIKGCSMGLMIKSITKSKGIDVATESLLLEASIVSIPADENALVLYADENREKTLSINEFNKLFYNMENQTPNLVDIQAELAAKNDIIAELTLQLDELKKDLAERDYREAVSFVDKAVSDGRIPESVKNIALSFYLSNPEDTKTFLEALKPAEPAEPKITLSQMVNAPKTGSLSWDDLDKQGKLKELKNTNFEEFKRLYREKFHCEWDRF